MITIFAEKPDVGTKIAAALDAIVLSSGDRVYFDHIQKYETQIKAQRAKQGYFKIRHNGEETYVTWGIGHLCELKQAQDYNKEYKQWKNIPLPFIPESYELKCSKGMEKQLRLIKNIFDHSDLIICATDDDREGDLIFDYIYRYLNCSVPFKRALFNQQSKEEWQKAFRKENLVDGIKRKPVIEAGRGRSAGDFVVGANLTTAMTLKFPGNNVLSVGRVQTAVLSMLVARELEIQNFKPKDYWILKGKFNSEHGSYEGTHVVKKFDKESDADEILRKLSADTGPATVKSIKKKSFWREKPYLYSLQGLQMDANKVYGFSLQHTLDLAQSLYEKGFTTYPRTDSSHLTDDMGPEMKKVIQMLFSSDTYSKFKSHATEPVDSSNKYYFDSSKVESHYAIVPTSKKLSWGQMSDDEKKLYDMIARSVICICYPKAQLSKTNIITEKSGEEFTTCGISILKPGYFEVLGRPRENLLPKLQERESVQGKYIKEAKKTEPPKRYTDQTLLTAMITCGKHIDDAELRKVMSSGADGKPRGLGRPSTQASIVTTLEERRYLERKGKSLIPTERGIHLISIFPIEDLKAPVMTAQWEKRLDDIEKGTDDYTSFITDLENSVRKWTKMIMELKSDDAEFQSNSSNYKCPICGRALLNFPWGYGCSGYQDDKCKFNIPRKIASKTLTEKQIQNLIQKGDSGYISGFVKNGGKTFGARIVIDKEEKKLKFDDDVHGELLCPLCGKPLRKMAWGYGCTGYRETRCNFAIGTVAKKKLTDHQIKALLAGESVMVKGMKGKNGSFDAEVRLCNAGENKGKLQFIQN